MPKLFLIDGSNHAFRVHFGLPPMHNASGFPTRVLYGFTTMLARLVRTYEPDYVVVSFDKGATFRHEMFPEYKGHRPDMPEDLRQQWPLLPDLVEAFGYRCIMIPGYEADDVLGTLSHQFASPDLTVYLVTGDTDFYQLVNENVRILDLMKDEELGLAEVTEKLGLPPSKMVDVLGLSGDSSDNIPGVPGVGEKTAVKYLQKYGSLEGVLAAADDIGGKRGEALKEHAESARLSYKLATIALDCPVNSTLPELKPRGMNEDVLRARFEEWDFGKIARKLLPERQGISAEGYTIVKSLVELDQVIGHFGTKVAVDLEISDDKPVGASFSWSATAAAYVPLDGRGGIDADAAQKKVAALLANPKVGKVFADSKKVFRLALRWGWKIENVAGDTTLLDYVLAAHEKNHELTELAARYLGHSMMAGQSGMLPFARPLEETAKLASEAAHVVGLIESRLQGRLDAGTRHIYEQIELPLARVLADMEHAGIRIAVELLDGIRADIDLRLIEAEKRCHAIKGKAFSVNSRHEIADALFGEGSEFTPTKKVKDGWSTDASVLEKIADGTNLPSAILEYRQLQKLKGTYLDKLPTYIAADGRIHTYYNQAIAATGRLSSEEPNLQNIPIRTFEGRRIRDCFVPAEGHLFLSADYSQIELRILAHLTEEPALVESFRKGEDIHRRTASEVFGVPPDQVTFELRSAAKAINFGLMYGMSSFRLAGDLQISRAEATKYMEEYFGRMPKVSGWIENAKIEAKKQGFVETLFGRRRVIPGIHAPNYAERMGAEREAVNTRIQGTAADIIKIAMLRVHKRLASDGFKARILLQVHDELLIEVPEAEVERLRPVVVAEMEAAAELLAPLRVNSAVGHNWNQAHG